MMKSDIDKKDSAKRAKQSFRGELRKLLYGFGDTRDPDDRTLLLLKQYVEEFVADLIVRSYNRGLKGGYNRLRLADIMQEIKDDEKMFMRAPRLLIALDVTREIKKKIRPSAVDKELVQLAGEEEAKAAKKKKA